MPRLLAFVLVLLTWIALHGLVARRLVQQGSAYPTWARRMIWGAVVVLLVVPLVVLFGGRMGFEGARHGVVQWTGFVMLGLSTLLVAFTVAVEIPRGVAVGGLALRRWWRDRRTQTRESGELVSPERRRFFADVANYGIVGGATGLSAVGFVVARRVPSVIEVEVPVADLHPDLEGLRIVQLSDVHVGPTIRGTWLDRVVDVVNTLDADVVALTGDFVDGFVDDLEPELGALARIESRHGAFFVTGNHEYYWDGPAWCDAVARLGPRVLLNEHAVIEHGRARLLVAGVTDLHADRNAPDHASDPAAAIAGAPSCDFSLLLAHQPRSIDAAADVGGFDLQLSGHTHGGQYFPGSLMIRWFQPYVAGLARHGDMQIYVSRGTGYWGPPNRAGSPSEITLLTLSRA